MAQKTSALEYVKPKLSIVSVTPKLAQQWLATQEQNRNVRMKTRVPILARDMAEGRWDLNGESIKFNADGCLIDGQHRLLAVIASGATIKSVVVTGLNGMSQETIDAGAARTAGDALGLSGVRYRNNAASLAQIIMRYQNGELKAARSAARGLKFSHSEILEFVNANPDVLDAIGTYFDNQWNRIRALPTGVMFGYWACSRINKAQAVKFFNDIAELNVSGKGDPKAALIRRFQSVKESNERVNGVQIADYIFRAWNAQRKGQPLSKIASQYSSSNFTEPR